MCYKVTSVVYYASENQVFFKVNCYKDSHVKYFAFQRMHISLPRKHISNNINIIY